MRILVLGGSVFLGRAFVRTALARGHQVTTFNRGRSGPDQPGAEAVRGDRDSDQDLAALVARAPDRGWDLVIDTSGQQPHTVARSSRALRPHAGRYLFVSSVHAFAGWPAEPVDEHSPLHECPADSPPGLPFSTALKAGCERAVTEEFGDRSIILNCGLLVGPHENIGRLPWWLERIARGGRVLAPGRPDLPIQLIDARDFAVFGLDLAERGASGSYVTTALPGSSSYGELLAQCVAATGSDAELSWVDDERLRAAGIETWTELPLWAAEFEDGKPIGIWQADSRKARAAGLRCRPVAETVRDTWAWIQERGPREQPYTQGGEPLGIDPEKERRILAGEL
ncbi:NAD-dependent epimerase/dehydratase family protein [Kitasatospora sp. NBC_01287]|uniref:NAD-dependent epimerase/dehydratase family protein n=1 Tax=Kitasatospora sp. NBC_01287 TaxID=2903573 RepID=UPI0022580DBA|nr:NAD-dependent epimerase/dehydratase family protein [Kitasatospora sp. NBC_01287]MCX4748256.1 NAD-dependent epimerase/dehydratase family protein [Kitasatospora sp. NBC_01287]